jgi:EAL domain-containing protein (putative c-di-GMP-specific phosphodiesterase class I)
VCIAALTVAANVALAHYQLPLAWQTADTSAGAWRGWGAPLVDQSDILAILGSAAFQPVFQPIVDLERSDIVAYEALTRFEHGQPHEIFQSAVGSRLHAELEFATLQAALRAARRLPATCRLHLNVSADLILDHDALAALLQGADRPIVLELTEDIDIADYTAFRTAAAAFGPDVRLAVDDAGTGFASLRRLVELEPAFVKLDRFLVAGIVRSPVRQALVAGLSYFALRTGATLVAEAIETVATIRALVEIGVTEGQGFLLAAPVPADELASDAARPLDLFRPPAADRRAPSPIGRDAPIETVINIGGSLGAALRDVGVSTYGELVRTGALDAWRSLARAHPSLASPRTLVALEASIQQVRPTMLAERERAALAVVARVEDPRASGRRRQR